jgi:cytochrome c
MKLPQLRAWATVGALALFTFGAGNALALDDEGAKALLKKNQCTKCHAVDKDKKGPSYQKIAKDNKGKADAEARIVKAMTTGPKVKLDDGSEEEHVRIASKDAAEIKGLAQWILKQ